MSDTLTFLAFAAVWILIQHVVLPRMGVPT